MNRSSGDVPKPPGIISPGILLPLGIVGLLVFMASAFIEYRTRSNDYIELLRRQSELATETLYNTAENSLLAAEVLESEISGNFLAKLDLLGRLDEARALDESVLVPLPGATGFGEILVYDRALRLAAAAGAVRPLTVPGSVLRTFLAAGIEKSQVTLRGEDIGEAGDYLLFLHTRARGGVIAGTVSPERVHYFRRTFGFGRLLRNFQTGGGIEYIALQNEETIAAGVFNGHTISTFREDTFLLNAMYGNVTNTRTVPGDREMIFESVTPFEIPGTFSGVLRMGFSMKGYHELSRRARKSIIVLGGTIFVLGLIFSAYFISHRHRVLLRNELIEHREYTNAILRDLDSGVIAIGADGTIAVANRKSIELLGGDEMRLQGRPYSALPGFIGGIAGDAIRGGNETPVPRRDWMTVHGTRRRVAVRSSLMKNGGKTGWCILLLDDVTRESALEERLRRDEKLAAMGKLAATIAHEIRNPLNSIHLNVKYLAGKCRPEEGGADYTEYFDSVSAEIDRIGSAVSQFISFARPPALNRAAMAFPSLLREVEILYRRKMEDSGISFQVTAHDHPEFRGDAEKLKQVLINLLENSHQAITPPGNVSLAGRYSGGMYEITCSDTGRGIPEKDLPHIFDLYYTTTPGGSGIGLAVAQQVVSMHDGVIEIASAPRSGTEITIRLPVRTS